MREDDTFKSIYTSAESIHGEEIMRPRLAAAQRNRCNVPADSAEEYYRRACFLPFVDTCLAQLKERFNRHSSTAFGISAVLPSLLDTANFSDVEQAAAVFSHLLPGDGVALKVEYMRWKAYWDRQPQAVKRPETVLQALRTASTLGTYPVLSALLTIFGTLPVTTATGERSFSSLKFIKNYLRSTMGEERLNGLAHMFINRDIVLNYDSVIDEFGPNRRLVFNK